MHDLHTEQLQSSNADFIYIYVYIMYAHTLVSTLIMHVCKYTYVEGFTSRWVHLFSCILAEVNLNMGFLFRIQLFLPVTC